MVSEGLWIDVAGGGEIVTALAAGADPATLVLYGNAKSTEEIRLAIDVGVGTVVIDNLDDIDRLEALLPPGRVQACLVRVSPACRRRPTPPTPLGTRARSSACLRRLHGRRSGGSRQATGC
jgi:diaminopimelate decarboxylase